MTVGTSGASAWAPARMTQILWRHRKVLAATVRVELRKRYSGSVIGRGWVLLYPTLFLSVYLLLYLVIFKIRLPGFSTLDYVVYIFSGLVPYLAFMETTSAAVVSIKQNVHLIRNVILPVELIPVRAVGIAMVTEAIGLLMVVGLALAAGSLSGHIAVLPLAVVVQVLFLVGVALFIAPLGIMFPDVAYFTNIFVLFLLFISPIGFRLDALPPGMGVIVWANPIHYLLVPFRLSVLGNQAVAWPHLVLAVVISLGMFTLGSAFFLRSKAFFLDYD